MAGRKPLLGQVSEGGTVNIASDSGARIVAAVHGGCRSVAGIMCIG